MLNCRFEKIEKVQTYKTFLRKKIEPQNVASARNRNDIHSKKMQNSSKTSLKNHYNRF